MKTLLLTQALLSIGLSLPAVAQVSARYELTVTNGSQMPISPAVVYVKTGGESAAAVGTQPSRGFIQLCQTGNPAQRAVELRANSSVKFVNQTTAPVLPGESRVIEVSVADPKQQSLHIETMYGKSKDTCGVGSFNSHSLIALNQHVTTEVLQKDHVLVTGAFHEPVVPAGVNYPDPSFCENAMDAISCVRELATTQSAMARIRFSSGYFPSLVTALEMKYGAADVQTLLFPTSGAIQLKLKLKH